MVRVEKPPRALRRADVSASSAASSPWSMPANAAMPIALCLHARRWRGWFNTPRAASARPMVAALCASSSSLYVVIMLSTVRRTSVLFPSVSTSSTNSVSSSCSTGSSRLSWCAAEWPLWLEGVCPCHLHLPQLPPTPPTLYSSLIHHRHPSQCPTNPNNNNNSNSHRHQTLPVLPKDSPTMVAAASHQHQCRKANQGLSHPLSINSSRRYLTCHTNSSLSLSHHSNSSSSNSNSSSSSSRRRCLQPWKWPDRSRW